MVILSCALWNNWLPLIVGEFGTRTVTRLNNADFGLVWE
jgi:hypothetical protein